MTTQWKFDNTTDTIDWRYKQALRDLERKQMVVDLQAEQIAALKKQGCPWCRMMRYMKGLYYGKPV